MNLKELVRNRVEVLLAKEFYCNLNQLNGKNTVYSINFNAEQPHIKIMAYKNCVVVCTSDDLKDKVRAILQDKSRDEIFELPFVYGQTIHYVPDENYSEDISILPDYDYECLFNEEVQSLIGLTGFHNSLEFDENGFTAAKAVCVAKDHNRVIGVAGAAGSSIDDLWEMGVDVIEEYRNAKLGTYLVRRLTKELLSRNIVPFYSASVTNIGSQMVAYRCGYRPCWVDTYGTVLDGSSVYNDLYHFKGK